MIILGTIPVGIVGVALQKVFTNVFAKPELAALFLAVNGLILLLSERMRRARGRWFAARRVVPGGARAAWRRLAGPRAGRRPGP